MIGQASNEGQHGVSRVRSKQGIQGCSGQTLFPGMLTVLAWLSQDSRTSDDISHPADGGDRRATQHGPRRRVHVIMLLCATLADHP